MQDKSENIFISQQKKGGEKQNNYSTLEISTLANARGQVSRGRGEWWSFVYLEFRSWPLNKLALQRWAALTMMYGRNTIQCCYELAGSGADNSLPCSQTHTHIHVMATAPDNTQSSAISANSLNNSSWQIGFPSRTYVSWLKGPTESGEICHFLQEWTQYWVLLWHCVIAFSLLTFPHHLVPPEITSSLSLALSRPTSTL